MDLPCAANSCIVFTVLLLIMAASCVHALFMLHSLQPADGGVNFILAQLYVGVYTVGHAFAGWDIAARRSVSLKVEQAIDVSQTKRSHSWPSPFLSGERDHRKLAGCLRLMLGQIGIQRHSLGPQSIPLFIFCDNSDGIEGLGPNLDGDLRVRYQIVIPVRVSGCASGGGDHNQAVALGHISHWSRAALAALGPSRREQEQGCAFPHSTNFAPICTELLNQAAIVVVHLSNGPSCYRCRLRRQLPYS